MTTIKCAVVLVVATIICLQHQMVSAAPDLDNAVKQLMNENMPAMVNKVLQNEPVVKLLHLGFYNSRFHLSHMTNTGKSGTIIDRLHLRYSYSAYSSNKMMYYAPRFRDYHRSNLAIVAFNMEKIFPCLAGKRLMPMCRMYTGEEDGFRKGRPIIEASDGGNNFRMFNRRPAYGFAVQGCSKLYRRCMPRWWQTTISCMLPRKYCAS